MRNRLVRIVGLISAVAILLVFLGYLGWLNPLRDGLTFVLRPLQNTGWKGTSFIDNYFEKRDSYDTVVSERDELIEKNNALLKESSELKKTISDLNITRTEQEFLSKKGYEYVSARVIARTSDNLMDEVIINVGEQDNVKEGFAVVAENGFLIGKIVATHHSISKVLLITDSNSEVAAQVQNETGAPGIVTGQLGLSLRMDLIPQNEVIQKDQSVITSGLETNIPKGLIIGAINDISINPGDIFQQASITSQATFSKLGIVSVIIPQTVIND